MCVNSASTVLRGAGDNRGIKTGDILYFHGRDRSTRQFQPENAPDKTADFRVNSSFKGKLLCRIVKSFCF